jgi:hypothetical protein
MYNYTCSVGNPEGTDFTLMFEHEKEFTREEFQDICEEAIAQCLDEEFKERGCAFICSMDTERLFKKFMEKGFCLPEKSSIDYYLEPYWGKESIRSKKLIEFLDRKDKE